MRLRALVPFFRRVAGPVGVPQDGAQVPEHPKGVVGAGLVLVGAFFPLIGRERRVTAGLALAINPHVGGVGQGVEGRRSDSWAMALQA
eukprot:7638-Eustigmatos_ZCMA.PRE.1